MNDLLSISEAASLLNVHPETLRRWDKAGVFESIRVSDRGHRKYKKSDIEALNFSNDLNLEDIEPAESLVKEVDKFPMQHISLGSTFTFLPSAASLATTYTHGIHVYPAKFIPQIPKWAIEFASLQPNSTILDPFCGSGTTQLEAILSGHNAFGIDVNPVGRLLSTAKTGKLYTANIKDLHADVESVIKLAKENLKRGIDTKFFEQMHDNWEYWFPKEILEKFFALRIAIEEMVDHKKISADYQSSLSAILLACLSSIVKKCSFFDEREIKVRKDPRKNAERINDPVVLFEKVAKERLASLIEVNQLTRKNNATVIEAAAQDISLSNESVDLIVTSPPYINAIDYAMAHKYSLFILGLIDPKNFKDHCRLYTGVTERAVRVAELANTQHVGFSKVDRLIDELNASSNNVDRTRAYIISQYFRDMRAAFHEMYRVLKPGQLCIIVVGDNIIRKRHIPTSEYLQEIAISPQVGFELVTFFFHQLKNVRLKVTRNEHGGQIRRERIIVLRKAENGQ